MRWLEDVHGYKVEKMEMPRSGGRAFWPMPTDGGILVVHTTQGETVSGAVVTLMQKFSGPHFVVGENRVVQGRPIGSQGASLHAPENQFATVQIEAVGMSRIATYSLPAPTHKPLVAVIAWAVKELGIPLKRPSALWKDDGSDMPFPWASNNGRRRSGVWPKKKGIYGHIEVPNQGPSWHYDPGALDYESLFRDVQKVIDESNEGDVMEVAGGHV